MVSRSTEFICRHLNKVIFQDLGLCGCGYSEDAYDLIRDLLCLQVELDSRESPRHFEIRNEAIADLFHQDKAVVHIVLSLLDKAGLTVHGTTLRGAFLTQKGRKVLEWIKVTPYERVTGAGLPHLADECTDECWD